MPRVKIDYIVSFSSEDPNNPASNLLAWEVNKKKWLCRKGETSCSVVLQLTQSVKICSITIGAHQAALVEVLVGRSETPNDPFQVLVPSSVFQSPSEARRAGGAGGADKVRSFGAAALAGAGAARWDRLRLVCSQPYNKHCQFGLSFVHVFSEEAPPPADPAPAPALSAALHSSDEEDDFKPGELFAKHLQIPKEASDTGAQIRQATSHALKNIPDSSIKLNKAPLARGGGRGAGPAGGGAGPARDGADGDRRRAGLLYSADDERPNPRVDAVLQRHRPAQDPAPRAAADSGAAAPRTRHDDSRNKPDSGKNDKGANAAGPSDSGRTAPPADSRKRKHADGKRDKPPADADGGAAPAAGPVSREPHRLLADVVLVLSGYENPRRAALRQAALALGAAAERDWGPRCTHLICAFPNTPKLRAVRAGAGGARAVAVRGEWLEQCARARRRLPWQWFATEPARRRAPPPAWAAAAPDRLSDTDTDDEIERVRVKMKARPASSPRSPAPAPAPRSPAPAPPAPGADVSASSAGDDVMFVRDERVQVASGAQEPTHIGSVTVLESDSDEGGATDEEAGPGPGPGAGAARLPAVLAGLCVAVRAAPAAQLAHYLRAYGAEVLQEGDAGVQYVVCDAAGARAGAARGGARLLAARWLWRCHAERRLLPPEEFELAVSDNT